MAIFYKPYFFVGKEAVNPAPVLSPLEMIAEWRKGCSCASSGKPEECRECTAALVDAIEARLRAE